MKNRFHILLACLFLKITSIDLGGQARPIDTFSYFQNYKEFTNYAEDYYMKHDKGRGSGYKQYMRKRIFLDPKFGFKPQVKNFTALDNEAFTEVKRSIKHDLSRSTHGGWEDMGPHNYTVNDVWSQGGIGRVSCVAFHPTNPQIIWVGTPVGGLWKTIDGGTTWSCITNNFTSLGVCQIAVNYNNPDIIYILTGGGYAGYSNCIGVMKTEDGGLTWKNIRNHNLSEGYVGTTMVMHPTNPDILYYGILDHTGLTRTVYYTNSGGNNWNSLIIYESIYDIKFKTDDNSVFIVTLSRVLKYVPSTNTLTDINYPMSNVNSWKRIAFAPSNPNTVYILHGGGGLSGQFAGLFKSTDGGNNFTLMSNSPNILGWDSGGNDMGNQAYIHLAITVNPNNENEVFVAGINCWKSVDGGATWNRKTYWNRSFSPYVHADFYSVVFNGNRLYACNDGGIYYSDDYANSWTEITAGLGVMTFYNFNIESTLKSGIF